MFQKAPPELRNGYKDRIHLGKVAMLGCCVCQRIGLKQKTRSEVHHFIGCGIGRKASDLKTINLCAFHHRTGGNGNAIHETPLKAWEAKFSSQADLLKYTNDLLNL